MLGMGGANVLAIHCTAVGAHTGCATGSTRRRCSRSCPRCRQLQSLKRRSSATRSRASTPFMPQRSTSTRYMLHYGLHTNSCRRHRPCCVSTNVLPHSVRTACMHGVLVWSHVIFCSSHEAFLCTLSLSRRQVLRACRAGGLACHGGGVAARDP